MWKGSHETTKYAAMLSRICSNGISHNHAAMLQFLEIRVKVCKLLPEIFPSCSLTHLPGHNWVLLFKSLQAFVLTTGLG